MAIKTATKHTLNQLSGGRPHNGCMLDAAPLTVNVLTALNSSACFYGI